MVVGTTIAIVSEALVLAAKAGVDPAKVRQALLGGFAQSKILEAHGQKMLDRNFKPGFRIRLHEKDMKIALGAGFEYGVPLMVTSQVAQMMSAMKSMGHGELDHSGAGKACRGTGEYCAGGGKISIQEREQGIVCECESSNPCRTEESY